MARTFLSLVQQACNEIGIPEPQFLIGNLSAMERQLVSLANREGKEFSAISNKNGGWQNLHKEYTFNTQVINTTATTTAGSNVVTVPSTVGITEKTWGISGNGFPANTMIVSVDGATQLTVSQPCSVSQSGEPVVIGRAAYDIPADFEYFVYRTFWDNQYKWELLGPITPQEKQVLRYGVIASGPRSKFYIRQNKLWLDPIPASEFMIAYDYYSNNWCQSSTGTPRKMWGADDDVYLLDEECFIQGLKWRFLRSKGMDYGAEYEQYMEDCQRTISRDGGSRDLSINGGRTDVRFIDGGNIPDSGFGQKV